jgi:hypothetical protein
MTNEAKVKAKFPDAHCAPYANANQKAHGLTPASRLESEPLEGK